MRGKTLHQRAASRAEELPGTELTHPFGAEWDVFKVRGKVFMLLTELAGESIVTLKASPDDAVALRQQYDGITPGYHMNKKHWITVRPGPAVDARLVDELVTESYRLVVAGLPKRQRPVDPTIDDRRSDDPTIRRSDDPTIRRSDELRARLSQALSRVARPAPARVLSA